ncbi:hypothetical protein Ahia01_001167700, partial [Argonauta hians]
TCKDGELNCTRSSKYCCPYSEWTDWGQCSQTCGAGIKKRYKTLQGNYTNCNETLIEEQESCTLRACPYPCIINGVGFNNGELTREDKCLKCYCEGFKETCYEQAGSVVDGAWNTWTPWSSCIDCCQPGNLRTRQRSCSNPLPSCGGKQCVGHSTEIDSCNANKTCCTYQPWSMWTPCSVSCGKGVKTRQRNSTEGSPCAMGNNREQIESCQIEPCGENCGSWSEWSTCSGDCGVGISTRRFIVSELKKNSSNCKPMNETKECKLEATCVCDENEEISTAAKCEPKCGNGFKEPSTSECELRHYGCKCKEGFYRNESGKCVSETECELHCMVNGTKRKDKDIWTNPDDKCSKCECIGGDVKCQRICEIPTCAMDEELFHPALNPCCPICKKKTESKCQKKSEFKVVRNGTCYSTQKVQVSYCSGHCAESKSEAVLLSSKPEELTSIMYKNSCECCQAKAVTVKPVVVICENNSEESIMYYPEISECNCSICV